MSPHVWSAMSILTQCLLRVNYIIWIAVDQNTVFYIVEDNYVHVVLMTNDQCRWGEW